METSGIGRGNGTGGQLTVPTMSDCAQRLVAGFHRVSRIYQVEKAGKNASALAFEKETS
jgi:hypothetical protein